MNHSLRTPGWVVGPQREEEIRVALDRNGLGLEVLNGALPIGRHKVLPAAQVHGILETLFSGVEAHGRAVQVLEWVAAGPHDALLLAVLASATAGEGLERICRYQAFWFTHCRVKVESDPHATWVKPVYEMPRSAGRDIESALLLASIAMALRDGVLGGFSLRALELGFGASAIAPALEQLTGCPVRCTSSDVALVLDPGQLERPMTRAFAPFADFFDDHVQAEVEGLGLAERYTDRVRAVLIRLLPGGTPSVAEVSTQLGLSTRALQRGLRSEGATYSSVLDTLRLELAQSALAKPTVSVTEVAFSLGFDHTGSFIRAFKRWTKQTPGAYRLAAGVAGTTQPPASVP